MPAMRTVAGSMVVGTWEEAELGAKMPTRVGWSPQVSRQGPHGSTQVRKGGALNWQLLSTYCMPGPVLGAAQAPGVLGTHPGHTIRSTVGEGCPRPAAGLTWPVGLAET